MLKLYDYELSGNCFKIRLFLNILNVPVKLEMVDFYPGNEHKKPDFLRINPLGQLPVLEDGNFRLRDAQAILTYLATKYDDTGSWYPTKNPQLAGEISQWLAFADMITSTASAARLHDALFYEHIDIKAAREGAHRLLRVLDEHLWFHERKGYDWICKAAQPTIADIANFPYIMMSLDGGISLQDYPSVRRWTDRVKRIPNFTVMPGIFPAGPAKEK